jgi:transcriptional regulator with XRE-family HTH domain
MLPPTRSSNMENNEIGGRIRQLRTHYKLGVKDFAALCNLSHVAIFQMENGRTRKPHRSTMQRIARAFGSSADWLLFGREQMLPQGTIDIGEAGEAHWKDEAYQELKSRNVVLEREVERLWSLLNRMMSDAGASVRMLDAG